LILHVTPSVGMEFGMKRARLEKRCQQKTERVHLYCQGRWNIRERKGSRPKCLEGGDARFTISEEEEWGNKKEFVFFDYR